MSSLEPNINHLKYFLSVVELKSVAAAAKKHHVSQPAISLAIVKLEEALEVKLMVHVKNRLKLTSEGEKLKIEGPKLIVELQRLKNSLLNQNAQVNGSLKVASSMGVAPAFLLPSFKTYFKKYPDVKLQVDIGDVKDILNKLQSNEVELGILMEDNTTINFDKKILHAGKMIAVINPKNLDSKRILVTRESPGHYEVENLLKRKKMHTHWQFNSIESWELILEMVKEGFGIGIIPDFMHTKNNDKIHLHEDISALLKNLNYKVSLIHKGPHQLSKEAGLFLEYLN